LRDPNAGRLYIPKDHVPGTDFYSQYKEQSLEVQRRLLIQKFFALDNMPRIKRCGVPPAQQIEDDPCCTEVVSELMKEILPQYSSRCNLTEEESNKIEEKLTKSISQRLMANAMTELEISTVIHQALSNQLVI